jgi:hypothetical protein
VYTTHYSDVHDDNNIHKHSSYVQFCNTERSKSGVISMGTKMLNGLPPELKNVKNVMFLRRNLEIICCVMYFILFKNFT